jgi:WhiB family transcriptional regulator, redox-sensing transcriptional regulator
MIAEPAGRDWRDHAACTAVDPELFYPVDASEGAPAVAVAKLTCLACPVRAECLADVMGAEDPARRWGITGGLTPTERTVLFARQRANVTEPGAVAA